MPLFTSLLVEFLSAPVSSTDPRAAADIGGVDAAVNTLVIF